MRAVVVAVAADWVAVGPGVVVRAVALMGRVAAAGEAVVGRVAVMAEMEAASAMRDSPHRGAGATLPPAHWPTARGHAVG